MGLFQDDDDEYEPYEWQVGDPSDWGDSVGVPDISYMGYINEGDDDERPPQRHNSKFQNAKALADEAWKLRNEDRYDEAMVLINRALEYDSTYFNFWNMKAIILEDMFEFEEALRLYDKALSLKSTQTVLNNKARCIYRYVYSRKITNPLTSKDLDLVNHALTIIDDEEDYRKSLLRIKGEILRGLGKLVQSKKCYLLASEMYDSIEKLEERVDFLKSSKSVLINIAGTKFYNGALKLSEGVVVDLVREPENEHDSDAIRVEVDGKTIGYVANSSYTLLDCLTSASDLKIEIGDSTKAKFLFFFLDEYKIAEVLK